MEPDRELANQGLAAVAVPEPLRFADYAPPRRKRGRPKKSALPVVSLDAAVSGSLQPSESAPPLAAAPPSQQLAAPCQDIALLQLVQNDASKQVPVLPSYLRRWHNGHNLAAATSSALVHCGLQASKDNSNLDVDYQKLHKFYLASGPDFHCASLVVRAGQLSVSANVLEPKLCRLAAAQLCFARLSRSLLERAVCQQAPAIGLVGYCEFHAYDETPLRAGVKDQLADKGLGASSSQATSQSTPPDLLVFERLASAPRQQAVICKILQTQQKYGMVLNAGPEHGFITIVGDQACPLQSLQRNTAETLAVALKRASNSSPWSEHFRFKTLATASDKGSSNAKAEKILLHDMPKAWSHLPMFCEVHDTANVFAAVYDGFVSEHVTGLINAGLSLRQSGALTEFRQALRQEIAETLVIKKGEPPRAAQEYRQSVMENLVSPRSKSLAQMMLLHSLPNGDWRVTDSVEHYVQHDVSAAEYPKIAATFETGLLQALLARKPTIYCRHRWTGCEVALEELSILEAIHGLLSRSYRRFATKRSTPSIAGTDGLTARVEVPSWEAVNTQGVPASAVDAQLFDHGETGTAGALSGQAEAGAVGSSSGASFFAVQNALQVKKALKWLQQEPLPHLLVMRLSMTPLLTLLHRQFQVCSQHWELQQQLAALKVLRDGGDANMLGREYMITLASEGQLEGEFMVKLEEVFTKSEPWACVPEDRRDVNLNHLVFKMLSRMGCQVESRLAHPHRQFPFRLFKLLLDPDAHTLLSGCKPCCMDTFSLELKEAFPNFEGAACWHVLHMHAGLAWTNIAKLESLHSSVRRHAVLRSTHTHALQVPTLSAEFVLQQLRRAKQLPKRIGKRRQTLASLGPPSKVRRRWSEG